IQSFASSGASLPAETARSEPPRNDGMISPDLWLGIGKAPSFPFRLGFPSSSPVITPGSYETEYIVATPPSAKTWLRFSSSLVLDALEYFSTIFLSLLSALRDCGESSVPSHLPSTRLAIWPP